MELADCPTWDEEIKILIEKESSVCVVCGKCLRPLTSCFRERICSTAIEGSEVEVLRHERLRASSAHAVKQMSRWENAVKRKAVAYSGKPPHCTSGGRV